MVVGTLSLIQKGQNSGRSMQLCLLQKGQTSGCSRCSHTVDTVYSGCSGIVVCVGWGIVFDTKRSNHWTQCAVFFAAKRSNQWMQWMQYTVDAVCSGCSGIVVYGGGDIVFDTKRSNQWTQWTQYTVDEVEWWYMIVGTFSLVQKGQTSGCSECSTQWKQYAVDAVE